MKRDVKIEIAKYNYRDSETERDSECKRERERERNRQSAELKRRIYPSLYFVNMVMMNIIIMAQIINYYHVHCSVYISMVALAV